MAQGRLYAGSLLVIIWGIAHLVPTRAVVAGFGARSDDNRRILIMEWVAEGLTLVFIGTLVVLVVMRGGAHDPIAILVERAAAVMLLVMAGWTLATGARTAILPNRMCPLVLTTVTILLLVGSLLA
jgi:hypothetical protein